MELLPLKNDSLPLDQGHMNGGYEQFMRGQDLLTYYSCDTRCNFI